MPAALPTPGYVYVLAHPDLPGWHKVGRTYRPPHARAQELSTTALPTPFEVVHARFFWDSVAAETAAHHHLRKGRIARRKEFFHASLDNLRQVIDDLGIGVGRLPGERPLAANDEDDPWDLPWQERQGDADAWTASLDYRMSEWAQGAEEVASADPALQRQGWRRWMRLSAEGWAEGSWQLAEQLVLATPGPVGAAQAAWVFDAAEAQGLWGGHLRAAWLRSWLVPSGLAEWERVLAHTWHRLAPQALEAWPAPVRQTLDLERAALAAHPEHGPARAQADSVFGGWEALIQAVSP